MYARVAFELFDLDGTGAIDGEELAVLLRSHLEAKSHPTPGELIHFCIGCLGWTLPIKR